MLSGVDSRIIEIESKIERLEEKIIGVVECNEKLLRNELINIGDRLGELKNIQKS